MIFKDDIKKKLRESVCEQCEFNIEESGFGYEYGLETGFKREVSVEIIENDVVVTIDTEYPEKVLDYLNNELDYIRIDIVDFPLDLDFDIVESEIRNESIKLKFNVSKI